MNSGLGELLSTTFAKEGCNVAINYFNRLEPAQAVQKECEQAGVKAVLIKAVCPIPAIPRAPNIFFGINECPTMQEPS